VLEGAVHQQSQRAQIERLALHLESPKAEGLTPQLVGGGGDQEERRFWGIGPKLLEDCQPSSSGIFQSAKRTDTPMASRQPASRPIHQHLRNAAGRVRSGMSFSLAARMSATVMASRRSQRRDGDRLSPLLPDPARVWARWAQRRGWPGGGAHGGGGGGAALGAGAAATPGT
jgi:hypothetical protein